MAAGPSSSRSPRVAEPQREMDVSLLKAAISGVITKDMATGDKLLGMTPEWNTCLHIASIHNHQGFCEAVLALEKSLISYVNLNWETPLIAAVINGRDLLALYLLDICDKSDFRKAILQQDKHGFNALHHAIRNGHQDLALKLIETEPKLSQAVSMCNESPLFFAAMRKFTNICEKLMKTQDCAFSGGKHRRNCLHAAVRNGDKEIAGRIMDKQPELARETDNEADCTPVTHAVLYGQIEMLKLMLDKDPTLGYQTNSGGSPLLAAAAYRGQVAAAQELLKHCPDAPYRNAEARDKHGSPLTKHCPDDPYNKQNGETVLHVAASYDQLKFVEFVLKEPKLRKLVNMQDIHGQTALHYAVRKCNPRIVHALSTHKGTDATVLDNAGHSAAWGLLDNVNNAKTLNWNEVKLLISKADPREVVSLRNLDMEVKNRTTQASREAAKSLTQTYTTNTSLVAILIATITFAAAFTLPGGYSNDPESEGLPIMSKKFAFQAFLISDVLAMCSSFAVAFICIIARLEDYEFLLYYRSFTKKLMWFAYAATTTAFSTGLYTVLAPRLHGLAIAICVMVALLAILTKMLGEWPVLKLRVQLGNSDLLGMV